MRLALIIGLLIAVLLNLHFVMRQVADMRHEVALTKCFVMARIGQTCPEAKRS